MTVKDAATNSLLMFVAATCVVLIVKALPQTQSSPRAGATTSVTAGGGEGTPTPAMQDGVTVYYLHGNTRCPTCRTIEAYAKEAVELECAEDLKAGRIQWQVVNYESPGNEHYATDYKVAAPNVVLVRFKGGKQLAWKSLPEVWEHTDDKSAFLNFVQTSLRDFLEDSQAKVEPPPPPPAAPPQKSLRQQTHPTPDSKDDPLPLPG